MMRSSIPKIDVGFADFFSCVDRETPPTHTRFQKILRHGHILSHVYIFACEQRVHDGGDCVDWSVYVGAGTRRVNDSFERFLSSLARKFLACSHAY